jgi:hypothetical protein
MRFTVPVLSSKIQPLARRYEVKGLSLTKLYVLLSHSHSVTVARFFGDRSTSTTVRILACAALVESEQPPNNIACILRLLL